LLIENHTGHGADSGAGRSPNPSSFSWISGHGADERSCSSATQGSNAGALHSFVTIANGGTATQ
jgi:hypothetical protein